MSILKSHYRGYKVVLNNFLELCGPRKIQSIKLIREHPCLETYPCQGHVGVNVKFENGDSLDYKCGSVHSGILMYYSGVRKGHCLEYVDNDMKKELDNLH